jgi:peptidoglycan/xylan/chitin deacetylase (PgdA/CDA1 family)
MAGLRCVVSLTFDDGRVSQAALAGIFGPRGLPYTIYLNTGLIGDADRLSWAQVADAVAAGAELGSHTAHHTPLNTVDHATAVADFQADIAAITARGYPRPMSCSYPDGITTTTTDGYPIPQIPADLGFSSGRGGGNRAAHDTIPPGNPFLIWQAITALSNTTTLATLQGLATASEAGGTVGPWVCLNTHEIDGTVGVSSAVLSQFLDWLRPRQAQGTHVMSVSEVINLHGAPPAGP